MSSEGYSAFIPSPQQRGTLTPFSSLRQDPLNRRAASQRCPLSVGIRTSAVMTHSTRQGVSSSIGQQGKRHRAIGVRPTIDDISLSLEIQSGMTDERMMSSQNLINSRTLALRAFSPSSSPRLLADRPSALMTHDHDLCDTLTRMRCKRRNDRVDQ